MAGKRQHFIPQFLQKGFISHFVGDEAFTWVYRKSAKPFNPNIKNVGLEKGFYTEPGDTLADDLITEAEGPFSELVAELRETCDGVVPTGEIPALIAHLEIRTRHLRQMWLKSSGYLASQLVDFLDDGDRFLSFFKRRMRKDPTVLLNALSDRCIRAGLPPGSEAQMMNMIPAFMPQMEAHLREECRMAAEYLRENVPSIIRKATKSGHIKALKQAVSPEPRIKPYRTMLFRIVGIHDRPLVLGDSPVIVNVEGPRPYKTLHEKKDRLNAVYLPLTPWKLLVGTPTSSDVCAPDLREVIARCAIEYFIAHEPSKDNNLLKDEIGRDAYLLTADEIEKIAYDVLNS